MRPQDELASLYRQAKALREAMFVIHDRDQGNMSRFGAFKTFMRKYNVLALKTRELAPEGVDVLDYYDLDKVGDSMNTIGLLQKEMFESTIANLSQLIAILEGSAGIADTETTQLADFIGARLRAAVFETPGSERDVQDTIECLLIGRGLQKGTDYDREKGRVKVSSKEVIPDFHFPPLRAALEVKFVDQTRKRSEVIDEINADTLAYMKVYDHVLFVVYDLGIIRDEIEFRSDLEATPGVTVVVVKH